jgi:arylsulfatase A-like enzyme
VPVSNYDYYPTLLDCAGIEPDKRQHLDGVSLRGLLEGSTSGLNRECLYWYYPLVKRHFLGGRSSSAIRMGDWKLIEFFDTGEVELYNLSRDPGEKNDLAKKMSDKAAELRKRLGDWRGAVLTPVLMGNS